MKRLTFLGPLLLLMLLGGCVQQVKKTPVSSSSNIPAHQEEPDYLVTTEEEVTPPKRLVAAPASTPDHPTPKTKIQTEKPSPSPAEIKKPEHIENTVKKEGPALDEALDFCQVSQDFWQKGELENALEALDQAYSLILNVDTYNKPKLIQEKENLRFLISKRILEIYASRNIVVNGSHDAIPLDMNRHVQAEINSFTREGREKQFFIRSYRRSGQYRPYIVKALKEAGLPEELSWLPLIESGFKSNALSKARALGLWQFISSTGYKFGLKRTTYVDERLDPVKSTKAAIAYLTELHRIFGDWTTVLAAYNCGEGRVLRVIRTQNVNYLDNFWDLYEKLPRETSRYVPRFLATLHILKHPEKYGLDKIQPNVPPAFEMVTVSRRIHLRDIAKVTGTREKELKALNPELRRNIVPGDGYELRVPPDAGQRLIAGLETIPEYKALPGSTFGYYRVRSGDTLSTIARRHRSSVASIMRANNLKKSNYIVVGTKLKIPQRGAPTVRQTQTRKTVDLKSATHVVRRGDSLWIIARRYATTTQKIQALNGLKTTNLHIGQVLKIPGRRVEPPSPSGSYKTYLVKSGDSPFRIAHTHKMPLDRFLRINSLTPRSRIFPGQALNVE